MPRGRTSAPGRRCRHEPAPTSPRARQHRAVGGSAQRLRLQRRSAEATAGLRPTDARGRGGTGRGARWRVRSAGRRRRDGRGWRRGGGEGGARARGEVTGAGGGGRRWRGWRRGGLVLGSRAPAGLSVDLVRAAARAASGVTAGKGWGEGAGPQAAGDSVAATSQGRRHRGGWEGTCRVGGVKVRPSSRAHKMRSSAMGWLGSGR